MNRYGDIDAARNRQHGHTPRETRTRNPQADQGLLVTQTARRPQQRSRTHVRVRLADEDDFHGRTSERALWGPYGRSSEPKCPRWAWPRG